MQNIDLNYSLVLLGILAIIAELLLGVSTGFDLLIFGGIAIISGGLGYYFDSTTVSLLSIALLSLVYVVVGRAYVRKSMTVGTTATNVDALMGKKAVVVKKITSKTPGQVKVEGEVWRAQADSTLDEGEEAVVHSVSGVTLTVKK